MSKQSYQPVKTRIGYISGRDAIFLDKLYFKDGMLHLEGSINGRLISNPIHAEIDYTLTFYGVLALKVIELDSWSFGFSSSFAEVLNSDWCIALNGKVTELHKHYIVQTYDDVIEIVCTNFELTLEEV